MVILVSKVCVRARWVVHWRPHHVETPSAAAFDEHPVEKSMHERKELALVAQEAHDYESKEVMMHVDFSFWGHSS